MSTSYADLHASHSKSSTFKKSIFRKFGAKFESEMRSFGADTPQRSSNPFSASTPTRRSQPTYNLFSASAPTRRPQPTYSAPPPAYSPPSTSAVSPGAIPADADSPYAFLTQFDTIFLIDDSGSMAGRSWRETSAALRTIAPICTAYDSDGIDIYFLNHRDPSTYTGSYNNISTAMEVEQELTRHANWHRRHPHLQEWDNALSEKDKNSEQDAWMSSNQARSSTVDNKPHKSDRAVPGQLSVSIMGDTRLSTHSPLFGQSLLNQKLLAMLSSSARTCTTLNWPIALVGIAGLMPGAQARPIDQEGKNLRDRASEFETLIAQFGMATASLIVMGALVAAIQYGACKLIDFGARSKPREEMKAHKANSHLAWSLAISGVSFYIIRDNTRAENPLVFYAIMTLCAVALEIFREHQFAYFDELRFGHRAFCLGLGTALSMVLYALDLLHCAPLALWASIAALPYLERMGRD